MEITVVGSGTVVPHPERVCACYHVRVRELRILFDSGPGALHHLARFRLGWQAITHVALTHFHTDHIGDLPILLFALKHGLAQPRSAPLSLIGPTGIAEFLRKLKESFGDYMLDPGFPVHVRELADGGELRLDDVVWLRACATPHTEASVAYRLDTPEGSLGYTGDTDFDEKLGKFLAAVDVLIAECSLPDDQAIKGHLTPTRAAALACLARPGQLVLTHVYPQLEGRDLAALVRLAGWDGPVGVARDGMRVAVRG